MLSVMLKGDWTKKYVLKFGEEDIIDLEFSAEYNDSHSVEDDGTDDVEPEVDIEKYGDQIENSILKFEFVNPLIYVGLKKPSNSFELLYLCKIASKHIADKNITDNYGHSIHCGYHYFIATYYQKCKEYSQFVYFKPTAKYDDIFIHCDEIVPFNIYFDGQKMDKDEYLSACQKFY